jgi:hypothetical protein
MILATVSEKNPYEATLENFDLAADQLELHENIREMINYPSARWWWAYLSEWITA